MAVPRLAAGNVVQVVFFTTVNAQQCLNVLHYHVKEASGVKPYFEQLDAIMTAVGDTGAATIGKALMESMSEDARMVWIQAQCVGPDRRPFARQAIGMDGTIVEPCNAQNLSAVITKQVEVPGRGASGSFHVPGLPVTAYAFGDLDAVYVNKLLTLAERINTTVTAIAGELVIEPVTYQKSAEGPGTFNRIINAFPQTTLRVMRRRTVGLGI